MRQVLFGWGDVAVTIRLRVYPQFKAIAGYRSLRPGSDNPLSQVVLISGTQALPETSSLIVTFSA